MDLVVFENEAYQRLQKSNFAYLQTLLQEERNKPAFGWLTNKEAAKLLDVTPRTMQSWRDKGVLGSSQVGGKIYYQQQDIDNMLQKHYKKPFKALA